MAELLEKHAYWRIEKILASRFQRSSLPRSHAEDLRSDIILRLLDRLWRAVDGDAGGIESFPDYVAVVAFNAFDELVRRAFPARARLKNRIRYVCQRDPRFVLRQESHQLIATFAKTGGAAGFVETVPAGAAAALRPGDDLGTAIASVIRAVGKPVALDALVAFLFDAFGAADGEAIPSSSATPATPADEQESADYLRKLWSEITALPLHQRIALLLHARDAAGESVTPLLVSSGIATLGEIADALNFSPGQIERLWLDLPLDDLRIAELLRLQRQQVINLRRSARDRLERRMRGHVALHRRSS